MNRLSKPGLTLFTIGAVVIVLDYAARAAFPEQWGGANIGGGLILMAAGVVVVIGAVLIGIKLLKVSLKK